MLNIGILTTLASLYVFFFSWRYIRGSLKGYILDKIDKGVTNILPMP